ncbi:uncharacterized protein MELLADRAFT_91128 [Melampsora larici-populina 98AG31]|uniref:Uncharacterized protein n=1 Tax=Melampsora larici-populina (strain 98AG31 / pathotype 3-4-7) TaxID=747676 RepID=F4R784_MELLP|nr:uncharacterized protein MELLADRAFT_91128 [Melampsora larici-populina 98AG31]EGG11566.1 hypothetical protein MELLADRAFT_91128 [Melampsora larici-populina 98AG31]
MSDQEDCDSLPPASNVQDVRELLGDLARTAKELFIPQPQEIGNQQEDQFQNMEFGTTSSSNDLDFELHSWEGQWVEPCDPEEIVFDQAMLKKINTLLPRIHVPTWINRPIRSLGNKSFGKLKADEWRSLPLHFPVAGPSRLPIQSTAHKGKAPQVRESIKSQVNCPDISLASQADIPPNLPIAGPSSIPNHSTSAAASYESSEDSNSQPKNSDGKLDILEQRKYKNKQISQQISRRVTDMNNLAWRREMSKSSFSDFSYLPSETEAQQWEQRKLDKRLEIEKHVGLALLQCIELHPTAKPSLLRAVEIDAAKEAMSHFEPIVFASQIPSRNSNLKYSINELKTCEGAFALAGFSRCTFDWTSLMNSSWNDAVAMLFLHEWEKCYFRGGADKYMVDTREVTTEDCRLLLERWFENKKQKYVSQTNKAVSEQDSEIPEHRPHTKNKDQEKEARKRAQKQALKKFFPTEKGLYNILSDVRCHSEDEVNESDKRYRLFLPWRSATFVTFLGHLDTLYKTTQTTFCNCGTAVKVLDRRNHREMTGLMKETSYPPKGFPRSLTCQNYWAALSKAQNLGLKL